MKKLILLAVIIVLLAGLGYSIINKPIERNSPYDRIKEDQILIYDDKIILDIKGASLTAYANTNSMDPFLDEGANGIEIIPKNGDEIYVGDIVAYESEHDLIVHRVIEKGIDDNGIYFITKGDNANSTDPKVRFDQIKYILVGVIY